MSEVANGWAQERLSTVVKPRKQKAAPSSLGSIPFVGLEHVAPHSGRVLGHGTTSEMKSAVAVFEAGDVLYGRLRPYLNKVVRPDFSGAASAEFIVLQGNEQIDAGFLHRFLMHPAFVEFASHINQGDRPRVDFNQIGEFTIGFPPIPEQRRIVAKLDRLFKRSEDAREELRRIQRLVERYKQAILAAAFRGDLTAEWRAAQSHVSSKAWRSTCIGEIAAVGTGATPKRGVPRFYKNGTIPWVTSGAVNEETVEHAEEMITQAALKETNCKVFPPGTLLVAMYGEGQTRGKVSVLKIHAATNQALAAISIRDSEPVSSKFVFWFLRANYLKLRRQAAGGVQPNLNLGMIKATEMRLPSVDEQRQIVCRIEQLLQRVETLTREASVPLDLLDRLEQTTLAKAFRGDL
jgi:type I restriction enzyme S subunit